MNYALTRHKNLATPWGDIRPRRRKGKNTGRGGGSPKATRLTVDTFQQTKNILERVAQAIVIGACAYALYAGFLFLTTSQRFAVSEIVFQGNLKLKEHELLGVTGPISGKNIFLLDLGKISRELADHPWVRSVSVQRVFPQSIQIELVERIPYARIQLDRVYVMDNFGVILGTDEPAYSGLPLIIRPRSGETTLGQVTAEENVIRSMQTMYYFNRLPFFRKNPIDKAELGADSRVTFHTRGKNFKIFMSLNTLSESFEDFSILVDTIAAEGKEIEHIDLSFKDQVVVKYK